jgi:hypothetical protein
MTAFLPVIKNCIQKHSQTLFDHADFIKWRYCYEGGSSFLDEYLERYVGSSGQEGPVAFERRKMLTPIPSFAKKEINAVKNSIARRLGAVSRPGGSEKFQDAVAGNGRGVDLRGSSMNTYIVKQILPELLVLGKVNILVDAPKVNAISKAQVAKNFQPYLNRFKLEHTPILVPSDPESPSDWAHALIETIKHGFDLRTGYAECKRSYRYYWLDENRGNKVSIAFLNDQGEMTERPRETNLIEIPIVQFDIGGSLMADACSHQVALLNIASADSNYAIDSNFPFLVRQRSATDQGEHMDGGQGNDTARMGTSYGLWYEKDKAPAFISPPSGPMQASLALRKELKDEIHELVTGSLSDMGGEGSTEAGLGSIGLCVQSGESRLWDHFTTYEEARPEKRKVPTINYPDSWTLKSDEQRLVEADKFIKLADIMVGETNKKAMAKKAIGIMHRGTVSSKELAKMEKEVDASPIGLANPKVIIDAKKNGILCAETSAAALGAKDPKGEAVKCEEEAAARAAKVVAAQVDIAAAGAGNPDGQVDPKSKDIEKEDNGDGNLKPQKGDAGRPESIDE